jgi:hypothetical protein
MVVESAKSMGSAVDRRPAIWPWLVMPLVTLSLFFALDKLSNEHGRHSGFFTREAPGAGSGADSGELPDR